MKTPKRIIVRVPATPKKNVASVNIVRMAYNALTGDPTTRLKGSTVQAADIQSWIDAECHTTVDIDSVRAAMLKLRRVPGARVTA